MKRDFTKTHTAIQAYDDADEIFRINCEHWSNEYCFRKLEELEELIKAVGIAYCQETSDINSLSNANVVRPDDWLRRITNYQRKV